MTGTWQKHNTLDEQALEIFKAAYPSILGVSYTPIAPYYTQLVAGTNYIFTVRKTVTAPGAASTIEYLKTHVGLPGTEDPVQAGEIISQLPLHVDPALDFFLDQRFPLGGWHMHCELNDEIMQIFSAACPQVLGYQYTAIAPYFSQMVNGTNYVFAAIGQPVTQHQTPETLVFIKTYRALDGQIAQGIIIGQQPIENVA